MEIILIVCAITVTVSIVMGAVYQIVTMVQLKKSAKEVENLAKSINAAMPFINLMFLGGGLFSAITGSLKKLLEKREKGGKLK